MVSYMALDFGVTQELNNGIGCMNWTLTQVLDFRNRGVFTQSLQEERSKCIYHG